MKHTSTDMARWSVSWGNPHTTPPGPKVLGAMLVKRGEPCPPEIEKLHTPGDGYCVRWELVTQKPIRRFSPEAKARIRRRNLTKRLERKVPLFAQMFFEEEVERRPEYFAGKYP